MKKNTYRCEILTPMFLAGFDPRSPELRVPSIKGMLRYWWRAIHPNLSLSKLQANESSLFGSADEKIGQSKLLLDIIDHSLTYDKAYLLPHRRRANFSCLGVSSTFDINLKTYLGDLSYYSSLFELSSFLGGLGKRSRRGYGTFKITHKNNTSFEVLDPLDTIIKLLDFLTPGLYSCGFNEITLDETKLNSQLTEYPYLKRVILGAQDRDWHLLTKRIMDRCHEYKDNSLGYARGKNRLASPIYITIIKNSMGMYQLLLSELHTVLPKNVRKNFSNQTKLIEALSL